MNIKDEIMSKMQITITITHDLREKTTGREGEFTNNQQLRITNDHFGPN